MDQSWETVHLSLGSNLGNRAENLRRALAALDALDGVRVTAVSNCHETLPWGEADQPMFLNLAVEIGTVLAPPELLNTVKRVETEMGREPGARWSARLIDIDLVLWMDRIFDDGTLCLPHRHFRERAFVLRPLAEIAPDAVDPVTGTAVSALAGRFAGPDAGVVCLGPLGQLC